METRESSTHSPTTRSPGSPLGGQGLRAPHSPQEREKASENWLRGNRVDELFDQRRQEDTQAPELEPDPRELEKALHDAEREVALVTADREAAEIQVMMRHSYLPACRWEERI
jgi:hypothetical protein